MLLLLASILGLASAWHEACRLQEFVDTADKAYPGSEPVIAQARHWTDCRRTCRLYPDCYAFSVMWNTGSTEVGLCKILSGFIKDTDLVDETGTTTFLSCPVGMAYNLTSHSCRTTELQPSTTWPEASADCGRMFPGTHLLEIRTADDQEYLRSVAAGTNVWLGMYRPAGAGTTDIRYVSDDSPLTYQCWYGTQPDSKPTTYDPPDCVSAYDKGGQNHNWFDAPCVHSRYQYLCEL